MASLLTISKTARAQFLQLPPSIRASSYQTSLPRRNFSASAPRKLDFTQIAIAGPTALLDTIHLAGVPWWAAIPLSAALIRCTLVYALSTLPARRREIVRAYTYPLAQINSKNALHKSMGESYKQSIMKGMPKQLLDIKMAFWTAYFNMRETHRLGKAFGSPLFSSRSLINFGTMLAFAEAIRVKCGTREGLLKLLVNPFEDLYEKLRGMPKIGQEEVVDPAELLARRLETAQETQKAQQEQQVAQSSESSSLDDMLSDSSSNASAIGDAPSVQNIQLPTLNAPSPSYSEVADPSMATEGVAWFQDLTVADPYHILPLLLGATILARINWSAFKKKNIEEKRTAALDQQPTDQPAKPAPGTDSPTKSPSPVVNRPSSRRSPDAYDRRKASINAEIHATMVKADQIRAKNKVEKQKETLFKNFSFGDRMKLFFGVAFFTMGLPMPTGILLYILTNTVVGRLQRMWLDWKYPLPSIIYPCKRPMRIKVRTSFRDA